jgi:hypothetical protein
VNQDVLAWVMEHADLKNNPEVVKAVEKRNCWACDPKKVEDAVSDFLEFDALLCDKVDS